MVPHIPRYDLKSMGALADVAQLILLVAVTYVLLCLVRMMRRLHAINRFWVERWWSNYQAEAAGDHQAPQCPSRRLQ